MENVALNATIKTIDSFAKNLPIFYGVLGSILFINILFLIIMVFKDKQTTKQLKSVLRTNNDRQEKFLTDISQSLNQTASQLAVAAEYTFETTKLTKDMQKDYNEFIMSLATNAKKKTIVEFVEKTADRRAEFVERMENTTATKEAPENSPLFVYKPKAKAEEVEHEVIIDEEPEDAQYYEDLAQKEIDNILLRG